MRHVNSRWKSAGLAFLLAGTSPALAHDVAAEAANKQTVLDFYKALNEADASGTTAQRIKGIAEKYLSPDYMQHNETYAAMPGTGSARDKLITMFQSMPPMKAMSAPTTVAVMAEGDKVMMLTSRQMPDPATGSLKTSYIFNMFKVRDGKLAEHWDVGSMPAPAPGGPGGPGMPPIGTMPGASGQMPPMPNARGAQNQP